MITYTFTLETGQTLRFAVECDRQGITPPDGSPPAAWTQLGFHQCTHCPLDPADTPHCPVALDIQAIAEQFTGIMSYLRLQVTVETPERTYLKHCDAQGGLSSLLGVVMATSACPILRPLRGLARFHLPFASTEETLFRTVGAHLIQQYLQHPECDTVPLNLQDLRALYEELGLLNTCFLTRLRAASECDANLNALVNLDAISQWVTLSLDDELSDLQVLLGAE